MHALRTMHLSDFVNVSDGLESRLYSAQGSHVSGILRGCAGRGLAGGPREKLGREENKR